MKSNVSVLCGNLRNFPFLSPQEPDEFYEGITFEHFLKVGVCRTVWNLF